MLKSTHRPAHAHTKEPPLPPGWTEHKAPSGHSYYYNSETKQSTYTRPSNISSTPTISPRTEYVSSGAASWQGAPFSESHSSMGVYQNNHPPNPSKARSYFSRRSGMEDRPKSKQTIPGCEPWLLVRTKLGRRFVYNPDLNESFWKFPMDVMKAVIELDKHERDRREGKIKTGVTATEYEKSASNSDRVGNGLPNKDQRSELSEEEGRPESDNASEEYEEIEVTDEEVESEDEEMTSKRQKFEDGPNLDQPVEFNEDDIAYQLEAMGQDYGLDPGEYGLEGDGEWEQGAEGLPLTEEDSAALFKDMLEDYGVNPYSTWDKLTENERIVEDERYTVLPNTKTRKEIWTEWSRLKIQELKEAKDKMEKKDPRIPYIAFLQKYATPKLYWPEFKRKYKKEPEMRDSKFSDKEREKLYREHISRLKLPDSTKKDDLSALLKAQPLIILNRSTSIDTLPATVLSDIRFISLPASTRDPLIDAYVSTLSGAPSPASIDPNDSAEVGKKRIERQNREKALANRQKMVEAEKRRQNAALRYGKGLLREEEAEIERAMRVDKSGLRGQIEAP